MHTDGGFNQHPVRVKEFVQNVLLHVGKSVSRCHGSSDGSGEDGQHGDVPHLAGIGNSEVRGSQGAVGAVIAVGSLRLHDDNLRILFHS